MSKLTINSSLRMNSGYNIPLLGYGVYQTPADVCEDVVTQSFAAGYRHIDSAAAYRNEGPSAAAMHKSGIPRSEIFFTSKIPPRALGYKRTVAQVDATLALTRLKYIDLMLIHAPYGGRAARKDSWKALVEAQAAGKVRSIGISNFGIPHLNELEAIISELEAERPGSGGRIDVGQWEVHPWLARQDITDWCAKRGVVVEAYCPIVRGKRLEDPLVEELAKKHGKTGAQVLLRWSLQKGFVPLPKSVTPKRIVENAALYDFELDEADMKALDTGLYEPCAWDPTVSRLDQ